ncbi:hypothetical protein D3C76_1013170 [compost metagenome]
MILQDDVGRGTGARDDIPHQVAVIDRHVGGRRAIDLQNAPVAPHQGGAVVHFDGSQNGRQAKVVDDYRRAGLPLHQGTVQYQAVGRSGRASGYESDPLGASADRAGRRRDSATGNLNARSDGTTARDHGACQGQIALTSDLDTGRTSCDDTVRHRSLGTSRRTGERAQ